MGDNRMNYFLYFILGFIAGWLLQKSDKPDCKKVVNAKTKEVRKIQ